LEKEKVIEGERDSSESLGGRKLNFHNCKGTHLSITRILIFNEGVRTGKIRNRSIEDEGEGESWI